MKHTLIQVRKSEDYILCYSVQTDLGWFQFKLGKQAYGYLTDNGEKCVQFINTIKECYQWFCVIKRYVSSGATSNHLSLSLSLSLSLFHYIAASLLVTSINPMCLCMSISLTFTVSPSIFSGTPIIASSLWIQRNWMYSELSQRSQVRCLRFYKNVC